MNTNDARIARYLKAVRRRLDLPRDLRDRVISDFSTSVSARLEAGESAEAVISSLGSPKACAAGLCGPMQEYVSRRSPWRFAFLVLGLIGLVGLGVWAASTIGMWYHVTVPHSVAVIGGADGPTSIYVAGKLPTELDAFMWALLLVVGMAGYVLLSVRRQKKR